MTALVEADGLVKSFGMLKAVDPNPRYHTTGGTHWISSHWLCPAPGGVVGNDG
jgi:hypothetical protein